MQETQKLRVRSLCQEDPLEKEMATHSSILVEKISRTKEPGGLHGVRKSWTRLNPSTTWTCSQMQRCFTRGHCGMPKPQRSARATGRGRQLPFSPPPIQHCSAEETASAPPQSQRACSQDSLGMQACLEFPHLAFGSPHWRWLGRISRHPAGGTALRAKSSQLVLGAARLLWLGPSWA